jgi:hypothetical protein
MDFMHQAAIEVLAAYQIYEVVDSIYRLNITRKRGDDMPVCWNSTYKLLKNDLYFKVIFIWYSKRAGIFQLDSGCCLGSDLCCSYKVLITIAGSSVFSFLFVVGLCASVMS